MSNDVFPTLPGLKWGTVKAPIFSTRVLTAASQRETRGSFTSYPRWKITMSFEFLRNSGGYTELDTLVGFFNQRLGQLDNFLLRDPNDYQVTDQALGAGDGVTTEYRYVRSLGGFVEPVLAPDTRWVYLDRGAALGKWRLSEFARTNLLARTDDLSNSYWAKEGVSVTPNAVAAPDGASVADLLTEDTSTGAHNVYRSFTGVANTKYVLSTYVKANGRTICALYSHWPGCGGAEFDLQAGTLLAKDAGVIAAGLRALSDGWWRLWIVVKPTAAVNNSQRLYMRATAGGPNSYTGDGSSGMYVTWWQFETVADDAPNEPTEYIPSTSGSATTVPAGFTAPDEFGYFSFASPMPVGVLASWTGTFYFRVRFTHDTTEFAEFMRDLYEARKVEFITEK